MCRYEVASGDRARFVIYVLYYQINKWYIIMGLLIYVYVHTCTSFYNVH